jgi:hypothetical protein
MTGLGQYRSFQGLTRRRNNRCSLRTLRLRCPSAATTASAAPPAWRGAYRPGDRGSNDRRDCRRYTEPDPGPHARGRVPRVPRFRMTGARSWAIARSRAASRRSAGVLEAEAWRRGVSGIAEPLVSAGKLVGDAMPVPASTSRKLLLTLPRLVLFHGQPVPHWWRRVPLGSRPAKRGDTFRCKMQLKQI